MTAHPARACRSRACLSRTFRSRFCTSLVLLGWCVQSIAAGITLPQAKGGSLVLTAPAKRIITLAPNLAELVFAAGAGKRLIAVGEYSDFPAAVSKIPSIGNAFRIDLERVIELKPDLVIGWESGNPQTALKKLGQLGLAVWHIEIKRLDEIAGVIENIARAAGTLSQGRKTADQLRSRLKKLQQQNAGKTPVSYFYQITSRPLYTINGQHIISHGLEICGGRNIFAALPTLAPQVSREAIILANPQAMIAPLIPGAPPALQLWQEWPQLQAVNNNALFYLPADEISRATPRLLDAMTLACKLLDKVRENTTLKDSKS